MEGLVGKVVRVAIPSFIQGISTCYRVLWSRAVPWWGRNPFLYSGHFNKKVMRVCKGLGVDLGRNPFLYSGHFNSLSLMNCWAKCSPSRNPFLYSGHFNKRSSKKYNYGRGEKVAIPSFIQGISTMLGGAILSLLCLMSQSLPLFRAFQRAVQALGRRGSTTCRNPFLYSGHFNIPCGSSP